ncbi:hypothetical protein M427DRAFT_51436 [Gonapodya prolifera JEL478]|uniref:Uncharacterized protein n=1 Tax=Gonapodya prolifera (strain JEL478) TaxID=1344416 RepID=A0A139AX70_GONPJ|nr:hypothetical protein M427DRAFT_51436 [Gonapodya prolifera JEL478]|eukprot:KXS21173.1 hypothetical protein M427DRAFT_51436 [Gonapodya prolifera JEL478]
MAGASDTTPSRRGSTPCSGVPMEATPKAPEHRSPNTAHHSAHEPSRPASFTPVTEALHGLGISALQSQNATVTPINPGPRKVTAPSHRLPRTRRSPSPNFHDGSAQPLGRSTGSPYPNPLMKSMRVLDLESQIPANLPGNSQQKAAWPRFLALSLHRSTPTPPTPPRSDHHTSSSRLGTDRPMLGEIPTRVGNHTTTGDLTRKAANRSEKRHGKDSYYWSSKDSERPRMVLGTQPPSLPPESQMCLDSESHALLGQTDKDLATSNASLQHMNMDGVPPSQLVTPVNTVTLPLPDSPKRKRRKAEMGAFDGGVIRSPTSDRFYWSSEEEESPTYTHKAAYPSSTPSIPPRTPRRSPRTPPGPVARRSSPLHPYTPPPRTTPRRNSHTRTPDRATTPRETRRR